MPVYRLFMLLAAPRTGKITAQPALKALANMRPDPTTMTVLSEETHACKNGDVGGICTLYHQWQQGLLKTIRKTCNCE